MAVVWDRKEGTEARGLVRAGKLTKDEVDDGGGGGSRRGAEEGGEAEVRLEKKEDGEECKGEGIV